MMYYYMVVKIGYDALLMYILDVDAIFILINHEGDSWYCVFSSNFAANEMGTLLLEFYIIGC